MASITKTNVIQSILHGNADTLRRSVARYRAYRAERRRIADIEAELQRMSDRDLADIGISRGRIFAVARGADRG